MTALKLLDVLGFENARTAEKRLYFGDCWVFCKDGDMLDAYAPFLYNPPAFALKTLKRTMIDTQKFKVPASEDPWWFMVDYLRIDPLLIVSSKKDLDVRGLHRYGHVWYDTKTRKGVVKIMQNENGIFDFVIPSDDPIFVLKSDVPRSLPKRLSYATDPDGIDYIRSDSRKEDMVDRLDRYDPEERKLTTTTLARCNDVDWEKTLQLPYHWQTAERPTSAVSYGAPSCLDGKIDVLLKWEACPGWYVHDGIVTSVLPELRPLVVAKDADGIAKVLEKHITLLGDKFFSGKRDPSDYVGSVYVNCEM